MSVDLAALMVPEDGAPVTELEQRMLDEAAVSGWKFSLELLRDGRRRGPDGLVVAQHLLGAGVDDALPRVSDAEELALVDECWRCGGSWLLEELREDRPHALKVLVEEWEAANEPVGEVVQGPVRLVRVSFNRVLLADGPIADEETGFSIEGVGFDICHDHLFEACPGWVPPIGTNPGLRVSYDPVEGFGFWADERLDCGWCVSDWMVDDGYELRSVERSVFEGVLERHGHRFKRDGWLQSNAFCLLPVQKNNSQALGEGMFFHGSMRFKPGQVFVMEVKGGGSDDVFS